MFGARINVKDLGSGAFFIAVGILYGSIALHSLPLGQLLNMGPGFFPVVLSGLLLLIGGALVLRSFVSGMEDPFGGVAWRAIAILSVSIAAFAVLLAPLGLAFSVFLATFIATFAAKGAKILYSFVTALALSAFCVTVFVFGAGLQAPWLGSWFGY